jgi:uncharacterized protein (TIGR03382 family)
VLASTAHAFPTGRQFDLDPMMSDGAGGIAFDGAPRFAGHTCAVCHTDTPGLIGVRLEADHPELFTDGWKANMQYHMRVVLVDEWAGVQYKSLGDNCGFNAATYVPCDQNGFALEFDDANGKPLGKFVPVVASACATSGTIPPDTDIVVMKDGTAAVHNGAHNALTTWDLCWTAPAAGAGTITAYVAAVDGNGGDGTMAFPNDTTGDDVFAGAVPIPESGGAPVDQSGGCSTGDGAGPLVAIALVVILARRLRRRALAALLCVSLASCVHVRPRQRETLAKRNMKFAPDPAEDELDLHMQEAREGSAGGYGSAGGGCGCN